MLGWAIAVSFQCPEIYTYIHKHLPISYFVYGLFNNAVSSSEEMCNEAGMA
jgi:hypothetical protein